MLTPDTPDPVVREVPAIPATARVGLLRANTAVAVVITTVMALASLGLWQSMRATRLEDAARAELWRALLAEAKSVRLGQTLDRRTQALEMLRRAAEIAPTAELRSEAVAALALPERILEATVQLEPEMMAVEFDYQLHHCAIGFENGDVLVQSLDPSRPSRTLRAADARLPAEQGRPVMFDFAPAGDALSVRHFGGALAVWDLPSASLRFVRDADQPRRPASRGLFSSDGLRVVAPVFGPDGFAVLDAMSGEMVAHFPNIGSFHHAAVRPGTHQFAAYDGEQVLLLDWQTGETLTTIPLSYGVFRMAWSPDGRWLAMGGNALEIQIRDMIDHRSQILRGHRDTIYDVQFDVTGERLAAACFDGASRVWNLADGRLLDIATDRQLLRWGSDGRAGWFVPGQRLELWRTVDAPIYSSRRGADETAEPWQMDVSADGRWAACVSLAHGLFTWALADNTPPHWLAFPGIVSFGFDPVSTKLHLIRQQQVETFDFFAGPDAAPGVLPAGVPSRNESGRLGANRLAISADGSTLAITDFPQGKVWVQSPHGQAEIPMQDLQHSSTAYESGSPRGASPTALSPDGRWLLCGADGGAGTWIYDAQSGQRIHRLDPRMGGVQFSSDGRWCLLATASDVRMFQAPDWGEAWSKAREVDASHRFATAAISPDGRQVALVTSPLQIALLDAGSGRELTRLESPGGLPVISLRWTPRSDVLVAAARDGSLDLWRPAATQQQLANLGLDWNDHEATSGRSKPNLHVTTSRWIAPGVLLTAGAVAAVSLLSLRRHRRLIEDFCRSENLALNRERELEIERQLSQLKSSFVSMVSHEFRTPLGITMSAVELLQYYSDRLTTEKREALLADIHGSTRHMSDLMEQVLLLGRAEAGKLGFRPAPLDLPALGQRLVQETISATQHRCPLKLHLEGSLDGAIADEALLRHILGNLLSNAVKYSPAGAPVHFHIRREGRDGIMKVRDQGIGIPEADLPHLFQAFHRAGNVGKIPGTGLGLAIVQRCVNLHRGSVEVASTFNSGTEFTVRLPVFPDLPADGRGTSGG